MGILVETKSPTHKRFKEVRSTEKTRVLDRLDMPWLSANEQATIVPLASVTLKDGKKFYLGNAVRGNLVEVASGLKGDDNRIANELFYAGVEKFMNGVKQPMDNCATSRQIYYVGNARGIRVYFMQVENMEGIPVIIRIAACHSKGMEKKVYKEICSDSVRQSNSRLFG